jgi:hypothetical protein
LQKNEFSHKESDFLKMKVKLYVIAISNDTFKLIRNWL